MPKNKFAEYPAKIRSRTQEPFQVYELVTAEDQPARSEAGKDPVATYVLQPGGSTAKPTGRIFIRLADGVNISERSDEIEKAGYEIAEKIDYAPNAGWLTERSGSVEKALAGIEKLESIKDVENVEPQMLMKRVAK
jgi:hypothetical protein